jgi:hypothetical protein
MGPARFCLKPEWAAHPKRKKLSAWQPIPELSNSLSICAGCPQKDKLTREVFRSAPKGEGLYHGSQTARTVTVEQNLLTDDLEAILLGRGGLFRQR